MDPMGELNKGIIECTECELSNLVVNRLQGKLLGSGLGNYLMFVGLNPSIYSKRKLWEDPYGKYFAKQLDFYGISKLHVYHTNLVKCSTKNNMELKEDYITACSQFLFEEIRLIEPRIIFAMGKQVIDFFDTQLHGCSIFRLPEEEDDFYVVAGLYHPSYLARCYGNSLLEKQKDFMNYMINGMDKFYK